MSLRNVFCFILAVAALTSMFCVDVVSAQPPGRGGEIMRMMSGNQFFLLSDKNVQQDLEMVDDQIKELEKIQQEARQSLRDMFFERQDKGDVTQDDMRKKMEELMKPFEKQIDDVLLPHQSSRLKQLSYQSSGRFQQSGGALNNNKLLDELEVTDAQREELGEAMKKAKEKMEKQIAKLRKEAEANILKILDSEQRKKYRELVGDSFQFDNPLTGRGQGNTRGGDRGRR